MKYYFRYIEEIKPPLNGAMLRGLSVDKAANGHFLIKASNRIGMKPQDFIDLAIVQHDELVDEVQLDVSKAESRDTVSRLSSLYHETHGKSLVPKSEESIQVKLIGDMGMQVPVIGFADLITEDNMIVDTKVRSQNRAIDLSRDIQLVTYSKIANINKIAIAQVVDTKEPKSDLIVHEVSELSISSVSQKIRSVSGAIRKRVFLPAPEGSWYCSKKWCFYWNICPYGESSK
ncbi:MAG: hypothetical protein CL762_00880 [Chloroflexi bacterium]|nr:hypothetical protein [Chloroflexota bacterium]|tara:strand:+ start:7406 stop:8098 length:693 start_codon:yes stop_codon:yes gene_type:complete